MRQSKHPPWLSAGHIMGWCPELLHPVSATGLHPAGASSSAWRWQKPSAWNAAPRAPQSGHTSSAWPAEGKNSTPVPASFSVYVHPSLISHVSWADQTHSSPAELAALTIPILQVPRHPPGAGRSLLPELRHPELLNQDTHHPSGLQKERTAPLFQPAWLIKRTAHQLSELPSSCRCWHA